MWLDLRVQRRLQLGQAFVLDVALQCTQRQVVLAGPSGAGKSLTLKAVAGLLRQGRGMYACKARPCSMRPLAWMCRRSTVGWGMCSRTMRCSRT